MKILIYFDEFILFIYYLHQVRFKVRTISFTEINASARGVTATTTTESHEDSNKQVNNQGSTDGAPLLRRRSSSMGLSPDEDLPAAMQIVGSMNDFGLGSLGWW